MEYDNGEVQGQVQIDPEQHHCTHEEGDGIEEGGALLPLDVFGGVRRVVHGWTGPVHDTTAQPGSAGSAGAPVVHRVHVRVVPTPGFTGVSSPPIHGEGAQAYMISVSIIYTECGR